jgi:short-subunit dehydrogenase
MRFFNTVGPVNCQDHYCLPPLSRFELGDILTLIAQKKYFLLHAPRQTGKTTCLLALAEYLNRAGQYRALYTNIEGAQAARENIELGIAGVVQAIAKEARWRLGETGVESLAEQTLSSKAATVALEAFLNVWCQQSSKPTVLMLDEVDALVGDTLIALLRQLRAGYASRPGYFPQSVILCGVRDLRDYRIHSEREKAIISGGSAFNIKAESLRLGDFSQEELTALYAQHSVESGQAFTAEALEVAWNLTQGQPWLVNALGYEACFRMKEGRERSLPITAESFQQAKENLILRRETHLDQLADKLQEERVRRVIQLLLMGGDVPGNISEDDLQYVADLGLIRRKPSVMIANPIYRENIPRALTSVTQDTLAQEPLYRSKDMPNPPVILITGASSGIGEATARLFSREGYAVALAARRVERLEALAQEIVAGGGQALPVATDMSKLSDIESLTRKTLAAFGQIDVLFNNAGFGRLDWLENLDPLKDVEAQLRVNLLGVIQLTQAVLPHMIARRGGQIINMASIASLVATPTYSVYAASKFAVRGFTESLRREVGVYGIRVSAIFPGGVKTEFEEHTGAQRKTGITTPSALQLSAEDVARVVLRVARKPRRMTVIPWPLIFGVWINAILPGLVDWAIERQFTRRERLL